jgi:hypothetical protein
LPEWQPIDTAPKDGLELDLWVVELAAYYDGRTEEPRAYRAPKAKWCDDHWEVWSDEDCYYNRLGGSHEFGRHEEEIPEAWPYFMKEERRRNYGVGKPLPVRFIAHGRITQRITHWIRITSPDASAAAPCQAPSSAASASDPASTDS